MDRELVGDRVDVREADQIADDRGHRGAPSAPRGQAGQGAGAARPAHLPGDLVREREDLVIDKEEAAQLLPLDDAQLVRQTRLRARLLGAAGVAVAQARPADRRQLLVRAAPARQGRRRQRVAHVLREVERAAPRDAHRVGGGLGVVAGEALGLLHRRAQEELGVGTALAVALVQRQAVLDRDQHVLQAAPVALVVVHVAGAHHRHARRRRQTHERAVARAVVEHQVVLQLDEDVVGAEPPDQALEFGGRVAQPADLGQAGDAARATAAEHDQPLAVRRQLLDGQAGVQPPRLFAGVALLLQAEGEAGEAAEVGVAALILGQQREVGSPRQGVAVRRRIGRMGQRQLQARDGAQPRLLGRAGELHGAEQAVVVGERQRAMALRPRRLDQLVDARRALQQRVVAVRVQLHVGSAVDRIRGQGVGGVPRGQGAGRVGLQPPLQILPLLLPATPAPGIRGAGIVVGVCDRPRAHLSIPARTRRPPPCRRRRVRGPGRRRRSR